MKRTAIIMAGGSGERFWPLSRKNKPKQLLSLGTSDKSMINEAVSRISKLISLEDIFIITGEHLTKAIKEDLPQLPPENVIPEPFKRNTAPALALASSYILSRYEFPSNQISMAILTADHIMKPEDGFIETVDNALKYVESNPVLSTIGIPPSRPETGYGYLELGTEKVDSPIKINELKSFKEKPDLNTAKTYLENGNYLWNSGMFFWRADIFEDQMKKHFPEVGNQISLMKDILDETEVTKEENIKLETIADLFESMPSTSIDYGLMEKADSVVCAEAKFSWDDIGDLCSVERTKPVDENGNVKIGDVIEIGSENSIFINDTKKEIILSGINIKDLVIAVTDDAVLISKKTNVQEVKKIVSKLKDSHSKFL